MILVLGQGLLGSWICARYPKDTIGLSHRELDVTDEFSIENVLYYHHPDAVINATGIVKSRTSDEKLMNSINGVAPNHIASVCDVLGIRMIQASTDCVFSGNRGNYTEVDAPDCTDIYGQSKLKGEVTNSPHLTVRTSFIGWPDTSGRGLLANFILSPKTNYPGYRNSYWNGFTVPVLADYLIELAYGRQTGLMHLYGQKVSKYEVLNAFYREFELYKLGYRIIPTNLEKGYDRSLSSVRHDHPIIVGGTNLEEGMGLMKSWEKKYQEYLSLFL
jgi:dTDP-4-dehydrorhamnose reductase